MTQADLGLALTATEAAFAAVGRRRITGTHDRRQQGGPWRPGPNEEAILAKAGYRPELRRSLRFFSMFAIAFSIISITTGIFLNYGFGLSYWGPASIWTWPIVGVGNLMIALVVAELGTRIPLAGYAYQWSSRLVNPTYGWFVGFAGCST